MLNLEGVIPILAGIMTVLMAYGKIETNMSWQARFAKPMKILGPFIIVFGLLQLFRVV